MSAAYWIALKTGPKTDAAVRSIVPVGPYIIAPQHSSHEYKGLSWEDALARAEVVADTVAPYLEISWGKVVYANFLGKAEKVVYYYDTSD